MKQKLEITNGLSLLSSISYEHREGGKYAYVQFLAYAREVLAALERQGHYSELIVLRKVCERLNDLLGESLSELHYQEFQRAKNEVLVISGLLAGMGAESSVEAA